MIRDLNTLVQPIASSRRAFLRRSGVAVAVAGGASTFMSRSARAAGRAGHFTGSKNASKGFFQQIQGHETAHVAFLVSALGSAARPKPTFTGLEAPNFPTFVQVARVLENVGVGAYLGAAPVIDSAAYLAAAGSILTIEARHSGWLNTILNDPITAPVADNQANPNFDVPYTPEVVDANAGPLITSLNGGPAVTYDDTTSSPSNDIAILNFALALEYLEAEFYDLNVPKFF